MKIGDISDWFSFYCFYLLSVMKLRILTPRFIFCIFLVDNHRIAWTLTPFRMRTLTSVLYTYFTFVKIKRESISDSMGNEYKMQTF